jgi:hypothetical protein
VILPLGELKKGGTTSISLIALIGHASEALPKEIAQTDAQYLLWNANTTYVPSWYPTDVERIKIRYVASLLTVLPYLTYLQITHAQYFVLRDSSPNLCSGVRRYQSLINPDTRSIPLPSPNYLQRGGEYTFLRSFRVARSGSRVEEFEEECRG